VHVNARQCRLKPSSASWGGGQARPVARRAMSARKRPELPGIALIGPRSGTNASLVAVFDTFEAKFSVLVARLQGRMRLLTEPPLSRCPTRSLVSMSPPDARSGNRKSSWSSQQLLAPTRFECGCGGRNLRGIGASASGRPRKWCRPASSRTRGRVGMSWRSPNATVSDAGPHGPRRCAVRRSSGATYRRHGKR